MNSDGLYQEFRDLAMAAANSAVSIGDFEDALQTISYLEELDEMERMAERVDRMMREDDVEPPEMAGNMVDDEVSLARFMGICG